jgi:predicted TIM-barrel fold metal-dependent hydrolase
MHETLHRRQFLTSSAVAVAGSLGIIRRQQHVEAAPNRRVPVVDTHLHCFAGVDDPRFPYHARAPYRPEKAATPEHLLSSMDEAGVDFAVVVHPEPYQDDHRYLEHCLEIGKDRLKGTCLFFADRPGSLARMPDLVRKHPGKIVAARLHAYAPDRLPPFGTPELRQLWKTATDLGLSMQLHFEPRYAPQLEPYIREFSKTPVVIDHLGRPFQGTPEEHAVVVRWSRFPNTIMKIASLPSENSYPHRDIGPVIKTLADAYGADRLIYGGGFGAYTTGRSYRAYRERVRSYLPDLSAADQAKVLGGTAAKLYEFG